MTLKQGEHFTLNQQEPDSPFKGLGLFVRNNGDKIIEVSIENNKIVIEIKDAVH